MAPLGAGGVTVGATLASGARVNGAPGRVRALSGRRGGAA